MQETNKRLSQVEFCDTLCTKVKEFLGEEFETEVSGVRKNNGVMKDVIYVRKRESECVPCFYLSELYDSYCQGENEIGLAEHMVNIVLGECESVKRKVKEFLTKEWMIEHLFIRLVNMEKNQAELEDAVYVTYLDLACVVYVLTENNEDGIKSFRLTKNLWDTLEVGSIEDYFPKVLDNTRRLLPELFACISVEETEQEVAGRNILHVHVKRVEQEDELQENCLYVLSNERKINGAITLLYPEVLRKIGERFLGDYYVIPSSVHEVLLLKSTRENDREYLDQTVKTVNEKTVIPEEVLSDHAYYYSYKEGHLLG